MSVHHVLAATPTAQVIAAADGNGSGRLSSLLAAVAALAAIAVGALALARVRQGDRGGSTRRAAVTATLLGLTAATASLAVLAGSGEIGAGEGSGGAIVALVLALVGAVLGGLGITRARTTAGAAA